MAYGLETAADKAPSLSKFSGDHLDADAYHAALQDPNAVVIDVRNAYETALGSIQPPSTGATLIDPQLRNSIEFPKWLSQPDTKTKLQGKKVLMYCTGGIRCERASALLNQMTAVDPEWDTQGVYELRGGLERYVKTFPQGGYFAGKNYLFDRRMEQTPDLKPTNEVEKDVQAKCCVCLQKWTVYRGQYKCGQGKCGVPVIVCDKCKSHADAHSEKLQCELCRIGYRMKDTNGLDLKTLKRTADQLLMNKNKSEFSLNNELHKKQRKKSNDTTNAQHQRTQEDSGIYNDRLFLKRVPLTATFTKLRNALLMHNIEIKLVHWLTDQQTHAFYGSCIVQFATHTDISSEQDDTVLQQVVKNTRTGFKIDKKKVRVSSVRKLKRDEENVFPLTDFVQREYPPIGTW